MDVLSLLTAVRFDIATDLYFHGSFKSVMPMFVILFGKWRSGS